MVLGSNYWGLSVAGLVEPSHCSCHAPVTRMPQDYGLGLYLLEYRVRRPLPFSSGRPRVVEAQALAEEMGSPMSVGLGWHRMSYHAAADFAQSHHTSCCMKVS